MYPNKLVAYYQGQDSPIQLIFRAQKTCFMDSRWVFTNKYGCLWSNILVSHVIKLIQGLDGHSRRKHPAQFEPLVKRLILA